nr:Low density lipoprotein-receptor and PAN-1 domain containing protein [Haemonchus contortus]
MLASCCLSEDDALDHLVRHNDRTNGDVTLKELDNHWDDRCTTCRAQNEVILVSSKCGVGSFPCRDSGRCLADDFRCDYEPDCDDGSDEEQCEDFLSYFDLTGPFKLVTKITEIWTYIPHAQGCAQRCKESSLLCEAFSYEPQAQICLLTDSPDVDGNLALKMTSQFYRKRFSVRNLHYDLVNKVLRVSKNNTWAHVCDDGFSVDYATTICHVFGYG